MNGNSAIHSWFESSQRQFLRVGGPALAVSVVCVLVGIFWHRAAPLLIGSYLIGYLFILGWSLGCMALLMLQHLTGGAWASAIRRVLEAGSRTMPLITVLFLPLLLGAYSLYPWNHPEGHPLIEQKRAYLNIWFFAVRAVVYFSIWNVLAAILNRWAREQETSTSARLARRFRLLAGPGLVLYGLTMTFAAIDWAMSLTPEWYSTIYGVMLIVGQVLNGLVFAVAASVIVARRNHALDHIAIETRADLGNLMLAFVMLWAYMSISQLLIIWQGNLPEEITWYLPRLRGAWRLPGLVLAIFHFFVPFFCLLQAGVKRDPRRLVQLALLLMAMRVLDLLWVIGPSLEVHGGWVLLLVPLVLISLAGLGGVWLAVFARQLRSRALTPYPEPILAPGELDPEVSP